MRVIFTAIGLATALAGAAIAQTSTDVVVMRRAIAKPRPKPTPTPTPSPSPTFTPGTAKCDTANPVKMLRQNTVLLGTTTGKKTLAQAIAWCESIQVSRPYSACFYDGSDGANFSEWSTANPDYTGTMNPAWTHYTCTKR